MNTVAIIPIRGGAEQNTANLGGKPLIFHTVEAAKKSKQIDRVIVSTDDKKVADIAKKAGAEVPFIRPAGLSAEGKTVEDVLKHTVEWLERDEDYKTEIVVLLEITHPFRKPGLLDKMIETMKAQDLDTVFVVFEEKDTFWKLENGKPVRIGEEFGPRKFRKPIYKEIGGFGCATKVKFIKDGTRLGNTIGIVPVRDKLSDVDIRDMDDLWLAEKLYERYAKEYLK